MLVSCGWHPNQTAARPASRSACALYGSASACWRHALLASHASQLAKGFHVEAGDQLQRILLIFFERSYNASSAGACLADGKMLWLDQSACSSAGAQRTLLCADRFRCVSFAGYAPCLAATKTLHSAGVLQEASPGKAGGQPGTAFSLVYGKVTDRVWDTLYSMDGVLAEWIRYASE